MPQASIAQEITEWEISGPAGANRVYLCTGIANINTQVQGGSKTETWTFFVGPALQTGQFRRAVGTASIAASQFQMLQTGVMGATSVGGAMSKGSFPYLVGHLGILGRHGRPVVHGAVTHPDAPGLYLIGYTNPISGSLRELGIDARKIARAVRRRRTFTSLI